MPAPSRQPLHPPGDACPDEPAAGTSERRRTVSFPAAVVLAVALVAGGYVVARLGASTVARPPAACRSPR